MCVECQNPKHIKGEKNGSFIRKRGRNSVGRALDLVKIKVSVVGSSPTDSIKRRHVFLIFYFHYHHASGKTFSLSYPFLHFGGRSFGVWQNRVYGKTLVRERRLV